MHSFMLRLHGGKKMINEINVAVCDATMYNRKSIAGYIEITIGKRRVSNSENAIEDINRLRPKYGWCMCAISSFWSAYGYSIVSVIIEIRKNMVRTNYGNIGMACLMIIG